MTQRLTVLSAIGLGAGAMYLLDPDFGRRRRALTRDRVRRVWRKAGDAAGVAVRDLQNRVSGLAAETSRPFAPERVSDAVLAERSRAEIGHVLSHPGSIDVSARGGRVTVTGRVPPRELHDLISAVASVRGVREVENRLEVRDEPDDPDGVPGRPARPRRRGSMWRPASWSPAARLLASTAAAGTAAAIFAASRSARQHRSGIEIQPVL